MQLAYCFDIETIPLPDGELELDEGELKLGRLVDPVKIEARKLEARSNALKRAALSPLTARIAALGILGPTREDCSIQFGPDESALITSFFDYFYRDSSAPWIGFNITDFDLPFIIRRAWHHGLEIPAQFYGRYLPGNFVDLAKVWKLYAWERELISLDRLGRFLGIGGKSGSGSSFGSLLYESQERAEAYLRRDLEIVWEAAVRMGVIQLAQPKTYQPVASVEEEDESEIRFW
jgi:hypothetical protein